MASAKEVRAHGWQGAAADSGGGARWEARATALAAAGGCAIPGSARGNLIDSARSSPRAVPFGHAFPTRCPGRCSAGAALSFARGRRFLPGPLARAPARGARSIPAVRIGKCQGSHLLMDPRRQKWGQCSEFGAPIGLAERNRSVALIRRLDGGCPWFARWFAPVTQRPIRSPPAPRGAST